MSVKFEQVTTGIAKVVETWDNKLQNLPEDIVANRRNKQNRTIKQIVGHLIDVASNNHQRMIRLQYNLELAFPDYTKDNDRWIAIQNYQHSDWENLRLLWKYYNLHMIQLINNIDGTQLQNYWLSMDGTPISLEQMVVGYLDHLNLHMDEIEDLIENK